MKKKVSKNSIDEKRFNKALKLRDEGDYDKAIKILEDLRNEHDKSPTVNGMLGFLYYDIEKYSEAYKCLKKVTELSPKSELVSQGLYLSCIELGKFKEAIVELKRYLSKYPAKLYRVTLLELLGSLKNGHATDYKNTILKLAVKHNIRSDRLYQ